MSNSKFNVDLNRARNLPLSISTGPCPPINNCNQVHMSLVLLQTLQKEKQFRAMSKTNPSPLNFHNFTLLHIKCPHSPGGYLCINTIMQHRWEVCGDADCMTHLTPAEKLTTGKKKPSVLKSSNIPCTGWPLIRKDMLGAPRSRQQLTTSSEASKCWLIEATARWILPATCFHSVMMSGTIIWVTEDFNRCLLFKTFFNKSGTMLKIKFPTIFKLYMIDFKVILI